MKVSIRIPAECYMAALDDLHRAHPFAAERIGFFSTAFGSTDRDGVVVCVTRYHAIPDEDYVDDPCAGARINSKAIRSSLQRILDEKSGQLHVHLHWHLGIPRPSMMDNRELPPFVKSMVAAANNQVHGGLILSRDSGSATLWLPGNSKPRPSARISVVGFPMRFLQ
jgi:hypothetical protein